MNTINWSALGKRYLRDPQLMGLVCLWIIIGGLCVYLADALAGGL